MLSSNCDRCGDADRYTPGGKNHGLVSEWVLLCPRCAEEVEDLRAFLATLAAAGEDAGRPHGGFTRFYDYRQARLDQDYERRTRRTS